MDIRENFSEYVQEIFAKYPLKTKLLVFFLVIGLIPLLLTSFVFFKQIKQALHSDVMIATEALEKQAIEQLKGQRDARKLSLITYLSFISQQTVTLSQSQVVIEAIESLNESLKSFSSENEWDAAKQASMKEELETFYRKKWTTFSKQANPNLSLDMDSYLTSMDAETIALQHAYLATNADALETSLSLQINDKSEYTNYHKFIHPRLRDYQEQFGYQGIYLLNSKGRVLYSSNNLIDLGTRVKDNEALKPLAEAFEMAVDSEETTEVFLNDYRIYEPAYGQVVSFVSSPIINDEELLGAMDEKLLGVLVVMTPLDRIKSIMSGRSGLGMTGETYLVGPDYLMRSDSFLDIKNRDVLSSFQKNRQIKTSMVKAALQGKELVQKSTNYLNQDVLSAVTSVEFGDETWALVAEIHQAEAFASLKTMNEGAQSNQTQLQVYLIVLLLLTIMLIFSLAIFISNLLVKPLNKTVEVLNCVAEGDLTKKLKYHGKDELAEMGNALNKAMASMSTAFKTIEKNMLALTGASQRLEDFSLNMSVDANQTTQVAEEMMDSMRKIGSNANETSQVATAGANQAVDMQSRINEFRQSSSEVIKVTQMIGKVAEQTNLLALNATIEAARAGKAGKGFAVVANEVKSLAKEANQATEKIQSIIENMNNETLNTVSAIGELTKRITSINQLQNEMSNSVECLIDGSGQRELNETSMLTVINTSQNTAERANRLKDESMQLNTIVQELDKIMSYFKIV